MDFGFSDRCGCFRSFKSNVCHMSSECPRQHGGTECGIFMCAFMSILSCGSTIPSREVWQRCFNSVAFRQKMCLELLENRLLDLYDSNLHPLRRSEYCNRQRCLRENQIDARERKGSATSSLEMMDVDS